MQQSGDQNLCEYQRIHPRTQHPTYACIIHSGFADNGGTVVLNSDVERTKLTAYRMAECEVSQWNSKPA